jgi:hypothetical protein
LRFVFCVGLLQFHGTYLDTLVTSWLEYFRFANSLLCLVLDSELGTVAEHFERNLWLPFTLLLVAVFGPLIGIEAS